MSTDITNPPTYPESIMALTEGELLEQIALDEGEQHMIVMLRPAPDSAGNTWYERLSVNDLLMLIGRSGRCERLGRIQTIEKQFGIVAGEWVPVGVAVHLRAGWLYVGGGFAANG